MKTNDKIKAALQKDIPTWDDNAVWEKIETQLPEEKKNRGIFWLFFIGAIVLGTVYFMNVDEPTQLSEHSSIQTNEVVENTSDRTAEENPTFNETEEGHSISRLSNDTSIQTNQTKGSAKQAKKIINDRYAVGIQSQSSEPQQSIAKFITKKSKNSITKDQSKIGPDLSKPSLSQGLAHANIKKHESSFDIEPLTKLTTLAINTFGVGLNTFSNPNPNPNPNPNSNSNSLIDPQIKNPFKSAGSLKISAGIFNTMRTFRSTTDTEWIDAKQASEQLKETSDFQLQYEKPMLKNLSIAVGFGFRQSIELASTKDSLVNIQPIQSDSAIIVTTVQGDQYFSGELEQKTVQGRTTITPNRYRRLYLPVRIGYTLHKNKSSLQFSAGVNIDLLTQFRGNALNFDLTRTKAADQIRDIYNNKVQLSEFALELNYGYTISPRFKLFAGIGYLHGLKNHLNHVDFEMRYGHFGGNVGINFLIMKY